MLPDYGRVSKRVHAGSARWQHRTANRDGHRESTSASQVAYNSLDQIVWSQDANGSISYTAYDPATGAVNEQIQDVNFGPTYNVGNTQFDNDLGLLPESWGLPTTGKNLVTTYHVDPQGRTIEEIDPNNDITCTVYDDAVQTVTDSDGNAIGMVLNQVRTYAGWNPTTDTTAGAIQVSDEVDTDSSSFSETLSYTWPGGIPAKYVSTSDGSPLGTEPLTDTSVALQSVSRSLTNDLGQVYEEDDYTRLSGVSYSAALPILGVPTLRKASRYNATSYQYNQLGESQPQSIRTGTSPIHCTIFSATSQAPGLAPATAPPIPATNLAATMAGHRAQPARTCWKSPPRCTITEAWATAT